MSPKSIMPSQIMDYLVNEWGIDVLDPEDVDAALRSLKKTTVGLADEINPTCLVATEKEDRESGPVPHKPITCGQPSTDRNHSIQENGVLDQLLSEGDETKTVLQLFPTAVTLVNQLKEPGRHPGSEFIWNHARVTPRLIPISEASTRHFACKEDDGGILAEADNLHFPTADGYYQIAEDNCTASQRVVARGLHRLAHRTLLFRISQFRGMELVSAQLLDEQIRAGNRFAVDSLISQLKDCSEISAELYRHKSQFDQYAVGNKRLYLVHHVAPFFPRVKYAASEYLIEELFLSGSKGNVSYAFNVIPDESFSWAILSHPATYSKRATSCLKNKVLDIATTTEHLRRKIDLDFLSGFTNLYVSKEDYYSLSEDERIQVEEKLAYKVCEEPHAKSLELLKSSPAGKKLIERIERKIINEMRNVGDL